MKRWSDNTFRALTDFCWTLIVLIMLCASLWWLIQRPYFWLRGIDVSVVGNTSVISSQTVAEKLRGNVTGTYFTADIRRIRDAVVDIPWVKDVSVTRVWPNRIAVELVLHKAVALWGDGEVLTESGKIFVTNTAVADSDGTLPRLKGPEKEAAVIYERFLAMEKIGRKYDTTVRSLEMDEFKGWTLGIKRGQSAGTDIVFGTLETEVGMEGKLSRILAELPKMKAYFGAEPTRIDARYDRRVAVVRPEAAPEEIDGIVSDEKNGR